MLVHMWDCIAPYGWLISLSLFAAYLLYSQVIRPKLDQIRETRKLIEQKKFDEDVDARIADRIASVRKKQQRDHDYVTQEKKLREEEAARKRLKELEERERKKSVLEAMLLKHENAQKKKEPETKRAPGELIDFFVSSKPIVVFSKTWCPFCRKAKAALATFRLNQRHFEYIELDERTDLSGDAIQDEFERRYGSRSVPKVFIAGKFVGGGDDVVRMLHDGELEVLVNAALGIS